ncbi:hydrogenase formation protein HypD [Geoglobus acetivorans]|uniref:[NiFe] hydrogenase metallocenter assembly protein HypD n=1 Tax=Geoglobus acetivorans TaxID=565033 RepID=A0A0A7GE60_GEOAI|nr:[NiFe] hydrogenase metallocenter assembly protein HypD [Geoglobus acetivorans]
MAEDTGRIVRKIEELSKGQEINLMHLCGTHEDTISKYNLRSILPQNVKLLSGPGCPVCIIPDTDLQKVFHLLENRDVILTTFGDMARVPFEDRSLFYYRSKGKDVRIVYSVFDAVEIAKREEKDVVFFGIGFETTMPSIAVAIKDSPENFYVYSAHRFFIPAIEALVSGDMRIDGFINPGHVSTIVGVKAYERYRKYGIPMAIAGFEPQDVLLAVYMLVRAIRENEGGIFNEYTRAVKYEGNVKAQEVMNEVFHPGDGEWRGLGAIPETGAGIRKDFEEKDAEKVFEDVFENFVPKVDKRKKHCRCGEVLKGLITPKDCRLFMTACTPRNPIGPCMVSFEGTCNIWAKYRIS